ncbi:MAG: 4Fe-4S binding protein [Nitrospirota bacterium]|nr:4Fe-4S binding protein [Nitrospirota bacterium]
MDEELLTRSELFSAGIRKISELMRTVREDEVPEDAAYSDDEEIVKGGVVAIDRQRCLSWRSGVLCGLCMHKCPEHAIEAGPDRKPVVNSSKCSGCGLCRGICPVGPGAIRAVNPPA